MPSLNRYLRRERATRPSLPRRSSYVLRAGRSLMTSRAARLWRPVGLIVLGWVTRWAFLFTGDAILRIFFQTDPFSPSLWTAKRAGGLLRSRVNTCILSGAA